jgi:diacylglycerol kinase family enzyme
MIQFDRFLVILNPAGTSARQSRVRIRELKKLFPNTPLDVLHTSPKGRLANQQLLASQKDKLGTGTLLCVAGGDGTVGTVVEMLATHPGLSDDVRSTPILPLWGGNANDLAHMLNGNEGTSLRNLFAHAQLVPVRPLECTLQSKTGNTQIRIAICYASFGATAFATKKMAESSHRKHPLRRLQASRFLFELATGFNAYMQAPSFMLEEAGKSKKIYERILTNGPRFAKTEGFPVRLNDNAFYLHTLEDKRVGKAVPNILASRRNSTAVNFLRTKTTFTIEDPTLAQFDGELQDIPAGTNVSFKLGVRPIFLLSTRLVA